MQLWGWRRPPLFVPEVMRLELFFFMRVFERLCQRQRERDGKTDKTDEDGANSDTSSEVFEEENEEVLLMDFQRVMVRLFRAVNDDREFHIDRYDVMKKGRVGWLEFCKVCREKPVEVRLSLPERIFLAFEEPERSIVGRLISILVFFTIFVSTVSFIVSTIPEMQTSCPLRHEEGFDPICEPVPKPIFNHIDFACAIFFTLEYCVRLFFSAWARAEVLDKEKLANWLVSEETQITPRAPARVLQFIISWCNLIDLFALMPWYLSTALHFQNQQDNFFIKMIRLMRVVRAFRLARRLEAVVIICRSQRKSLRAVHVLVLNLFLGMLIFGALMYFAEERVWNPKTLAWERDGIDGWEKHPFDSIPACFWWAIVTATTVGYGDNHTPRTPPGKAVACLTMVWTVCVLALPIGVIGGNFIQVWKDYDQETKMEHARKLEEEAMMNKAMTWADPLYYSRRLLIEVWHDCALNVSDKSNECSMSEFMGEVEVLIDVPSDEAVTRLYDRVPIMANHAKARRRVRGHLTFEYSWQPRGKEDYSTGCSLSGLLEIRVIEGVNLINIDMRGPEYSEPFCCVIAHPYAPDKDGTISEVKRRTRKVCGTLSPKWDDKVNFDVHWMTPTHPVNFMASMSMVTRQTCRSSTKSVPSLKDASSKVLQGMGGKPGEKDENGQPTIGRISSLPASVGREKSRSLPGFPENMDGQVSHVLSELPAKPPVTLLPQVPRSDPKEYEALLLGLPSLEAAVADLKNTVPEVKLEVSEALRTVEAILGILRGVEPTSPKTTSVALDVHKALLLPNHDGNLTENAARKAIVFPSHDGNITEDAARKKPSTESC
eukprot:TRINITY_DN33692_c0_g1_i1.p1 TRINITY_DN33692_c0_g1~~TRINITY_DN33692_c0_g1_i1.p1  ORF type:complete len:830 (-),score=131.13 TRINITY_DN33692_c0_g1_i1:58-2547(-)